VNGQIMYGAFTGKASSVLRKKGCKDAKTIHSMIYRLDNPDQPEPVFVLNKDSEVKNARLVVIDECSMVDESIGNDLLSYGTKILVIGDPAQLPPVKGAGFFTSNEPNILLTEVHRQAAENPIIALSMKIRNGERIEVGNYGDSKVITRKDVNAEIVMLADQVIVGLNRTRELYNARMRALLGRVTSAPVAGDKLICLRNDRKKGFFNGTMWEATKIKTHGSRYKLRVDSLDEPGVTQKKATVLCGFFDGSSAEYDWAMKKGTQEFTFGYAITCHKSQGSQWNNATVFDESGYFREDKNRWLYTAVTRSAEKLTLIVN
jgi:ATP-dependent exoDNAse (exonuclease V) alpha subunit